MKKSKTTILFLLLPIFLFGQELNNQEIEVLGIGKVTTNADFTTLTISLSETNDDRGQLMKKLNDESEIIRKDLMDYGFKQDQITLTDFNIEDNNQYAEPPTDRKRFEGYRGIMVKYNFDYDFNAKVINKLATHSLKPYFQFDFQLSDEKKEKTRKVLMEQALLDAKAKAEIIANTYKVKLKRVIKIRYGEQTFTPNIEVNTVDLVTSTIRPTLGKVIDSPSIDYRESIVVTWEFE